MRVPAGGAVPTARSQSRAEPADIYALEDLPAPPVPLPRAQKVAGGAEGHVSRRMPASPSDRKGLPPWVYSLIGGGAVLLVGLAIVMVRTFSSGSTRPESPEFSSQPAARAVLEAATGEGAAGAPQAAASASESQLPGTEAAMVSNGSLPASGSSALAGSAPTASSAHPDSAPPAAADPAAVAAESRSTPQPDRHAQEGAATLLAAGPRLTTAQIVERWEPSVALIKGKTSSGTGFLVKRGVVATNAHVIDDEFINNLEVRFPSAPAGKQGPLPAELLYEDPKRDLAFLAVRSDLPPVEIAPTFKFIKGEDITVIGNPGLGDEVVLENAISRGVLSSKTVIDGQNYIQLSATVNPGNSGGPVFDETGHVIGVVTLKSTKAEALTFCIPVEDLRAAVSKVGEPQPGLASHHRAELAFKLLTTGGALYAIGLDIRTAVLQSAVPGATRVNLVPNDDVQKFDQLLTTLDQKVFSLADGEIPRLRSDQALSRVTQSRYQDLAANYRAMKSLYANPRSPADQYAMQAQNLRTRHLQLVQSLQGDLKIEVPPKLLAILQQHTPVSQPPTVVAEILPPQLHSRLIRGPLAQRGPNIGARLPGAMNPAPGAIIGPRLPGGMNSAGQLARDQMRAARERMQANQKRIQDMRDRARGLRSRINP